MKAIIVLLLLSSFAVEPVKVYVCRSGTSYAYHNRYCQGLRRCSHRIDTLTIQEAIKTGHKTPCGYCYGR